MAEGLARLAELANAESKRTMAKLLRANASNYSVEESWVRESYKNAERCDREAEALERDY